MLITARHMVPKAVCTGHGGGSFICCESVGYAVHVVIHGPRATQVHLTTWHILDPQHVLLSVMLICPATQDVYKWVPI